jgi:hypothetical protein
VFCHYGEEWCLLFGKVLMTNLEYYITHVFPTGFQSIRGTFRIWADLMTGNYKDYTLMWYDDPYEECYNWFWSSLGEDEVLPKSFLEHLIQMAEDVRTGKEKVVPLDKDFFDRLKDLTDDVELD